MLNVKGRDDLVRDPESKAILSKDMNALEQHRKKKAAFQSISTNAQRIDKLESDISAIKSLLEKLLEKQ